MIEEEDEILKSLQKLAVLIGEGQEVKENQITEFLVNSVCYAVESRCGIRDDTLDFSFICGFSENEEVLYRTGRLVSHLSGRIVLQIARTMKNIDLERRQYYGTTKLEGEYDVMNYCEKAVVIRTAWLYSTFGNNFVKTMLRLGKEKETLGVVFDQIGTPTYARDLARAIFTAIYKGVVPGVYHFSDEGVCSWYDFTKAIHRIAGITTCKVSPLHTNEYPAKAPRPHYSVLDKTKIKTTYNIEIPHWEESLEACIKELNA
jgi:hypothetical protein